jgi:hypothetical protein
MMLPGTECSLLVMAEHRGLPLRTARKILLLTAFSENPQNTESDLAEEAYAMCAILNSNSALAAMILRDLEFQRLVLLPPENPREKLASIRSRILEILDSANTPISDAEPW